MKYLIVLTSILLLTHCSTKEYEPSTEPLESPIESLLQAISIVDENTAWISGHDATFVLTKDGGESWRKNGG